MKFKILSITFLLILYAINGMSQSFNSISKKISKYEFNTGVRKVKKDYFFDIRKNLDSLDKLNFTTKNDTLFLLESSSIENGEFYGRIWNTFDKVAYVYNNGKFNFDANQVYTDYTCKLVQNWDTTLIRYEEKTHPLGITRRNIYATRVIKSKGVLKIDCIMFKEFFLIDIDR